MKILFVCTGNTCRSPMAEALARKMLADRLGVKESELGERGYRVLALATTPTLVAAHNIPWEQNASQPVVASLSVAPQYINTSDVSDASDGSVNAKKTEFEVNALLTSIPAELQRFR